MMTVDLAVNRRVLMIGEHSQISSHSECLNAIEKILRCSGEISVKSWRGVCWDGAEEPYEVVCHENGTSQEDSIKQALCQVKPFALVIIDVQARQADEVLQVLERFWQVDPLIQVVLCSDAANDLRSLELANLSKPDHVLFLRTPVDPIEVHQVATVLTQKRHWQLEATRGVSGMTGQSPNRPGQEEGFEIAGNIEDWESLETTLRRQTQELSRSNRELEQFASVAAHDLREPLHTIQVYLDLLQVKYGKDLSRKGLSYVEKAKRGAERLQKLIQGLLVYSKVQETPTKTTLICVKELVEDIVDDFRGQIDRNQICVEIGELPTIHGDLTGLRQLLQNLIGNAVKFQRPGEATPRIKISGQIIQERRQGRSSQAGQLCQIQVQDWGIGIPEENIDKIFRMFKRLHRRDEYEGVGIGLAICKKVVEHWGGQISIQSSLGEGSIFTVTFPVPLSVFS